MSEVGFFVFNICVNILETFLMLGFITNYLEFREDIKHKIRVFCVTWVILFFVIQVMNSITMYEGILFFLPAFIMGGYALKVLQGKKLEKLFVSIIPLVCIALINSSVAGIQTLIWKEHMSEMILNRRYEYVFMLIITKILLFIVFICIIKLKKKIKELPENKLWILFVVILLTSIVSVYFIYMTLLGGCKESKYLYYLLISIIGIVIMNIITFYFLKRIGKETELRQEIELLQQNAFYQQENIKNIVQEQERIKKIRHDMKNVILAIQGLAKKEASDKITSYCMKYMGEIGSDNSVVYTGINTIDNLLSYKFGIAESEDIQVKVEVTKLELKEIDDMHLCMILGNLLDNAIEALRKIGNKRKYLELIIEQTKDSYIDIFVKNTIESSVLEKNPQFLTTKSKKEIHGFGVRNVKELVKFYEGMIDFVENENMFVCNIKI